MTSTLKYPVTAPTVTITFTGENLYSWNRVNERYRQRGKNDASGDSKITASKRTFATLGYNFQLTDSTDVDALAFTLDALFAEHGAEEMELTLDLGVTTKIFIVKIKSLSFDRRTAQLNTIPGNLKVGVVEITQ